MELKINDRKIFEDFETERAEKMHSLCSDSYYSEKKFIAIINSLGRKEANITKALEYAKTLNFSKNSLKSSYLSHPLRLASFLIEMEPTIASDHIVIALLHNVPETTEISIAELEKIFGKNVATGIDTLVVDRKVSFPSIEESYYKAIFEQGKSLVLIKLLDKIDNLFVLCLNADDEIRKNYIIEVREKLLPFAFKYNKQLGEYLDELLNLTVKLGFSEKLKKQLTEYQQSIKTS
ncbi:MAG: bifunctional (p)ppGpp synthetase/guanosine-3',5'-bis(diphosphate) 3'-pyrophosphohydrolase [Bacteroidetes bacterium]|nr:bifunctional (p)ppGpp synthetase/guanosine-3',5'-bis(diphosphate) 3'-pyrophosphohydrolase [Bacteroidota bacterium]